MSDKKRILVVDDDPDIVRLLSKRLREDGYHVDSAGDGIACMSEIRRNRPDLVVLDLGLPAGDGFVTLERLRTNAAYEGLPVVVLTGRDASECEQQAIDAGANAFFQKTAGRDEFLATISRIAGAA